MRCLPFLLRCVDKFLWYFASFLSKEAIIFSGVPFLTSPKCIFLLARGLREKCNLISQFWTCWIFIFWNRCSLTHTKCRTSNVKDIYKYKYKYIYICYDSAWKHLRQPCANLAPSLCFAGFPCMTPHNENVKSYKSVGCVPPSLKFEYRTFDRLSYIYTRDFTRSPVVTMGWVGVGWGGADDVPCTWTHLWCYGDDDVPCTSTHLWCCRNDCSSGKICVAPKDASLMLRRTGLRAG